MKNFLRKKFVLFLFIGLSSVSLNFLFINCSGNGGGFSADLASNDPVPDNSLSETPTSLSISQISLTVETPNPLYFQGVSGNLLNLWGACSSGEYAEAYILYKTLDASGTVKDSNKDQYSPNASHPGIPCISGRWNLSNLPYGDTLTAGQTYFMELSIIIYDSSGNQINQDTQNVKFELRLISSSSTDSNSSVPVDAVAPSEPAPQPMVTCVPNIVVSCSLANGTGTRKCNSSGTAWGICTATSCNAGYTLVNGTCQMNLVCQPNNTVQCSVLNGIGSKTCNLFGTGYGACTVKSCNTGYVISNNTCQKVVCGNKIQELGEQCDDGNTASGDGCSNSCTLETCTEVWTNAVGESPVAQTCMAWLGTNKVRAKLGSGGVLDGYCVHKGVYTVYPGNSIAYPKANNFGQIVMFAWEKNSLTQYLKRQCK